MKLESAHQNQVAHDDQGLAFAFDDVRCVTRSVAVKEYFGGRLGDYRVRVVYDISFWTEEPRVEDLLSHIDLLGRQIILAFTQNASWQRMECELIHHMAHAATGTTTDDDSRWVEEMARLKAAGAPVEQ